MITVPQFIDERGCLTAIEHVILPFNPVRSFLIHDAPVAQIRGGHAHYKTQQFLICIQGSVKVYLHDGMKQLITILGQGETIYIPNLVWDSQEFLEEHTIMIVYCSTPFDKNDHINDFKPFTELKNG